MADDTKAPNERLTANGVRAPYTTPIFQQFGKLNRLTQGSFDVGADGSSGMTMNATMGMGMNMNMNMNMGMGMGMGMGGFF